ncbi:MAG: phosphatidylserine decarboxylase family protein [Verrucomicrobia bacterium]|nr:phosphatidylserine decarboxylase family protein [Verrucomicrobiota bacterium]
MQHAGKARKEGMRLILWSSLLWLCVLAAAWLALANTSLFRALAAATGGIWLLFFGFCLNFFRDPDPDVPADSDAIVAPAHGTVDVIEETDEREFMGSRCLRISTFLSVFDVHVQNAPVSGKIVYLQDHRGKFFNAMRADFSSQNENALIGIESANLPGGRIAVRLIAGLIARRIVPWVAVEDRVGRGERISLIRFGSRVDLYLPLAARVEVRLGDKVKGGETVMARAGAVEGSMAPLHKSPSPRHGASWTQFSAEDRSERRVRAE